MALLQLYSAQEDRHRAVLLAEFLNSLGTHCELITAESAPASDPVLVVWTSAAARKPWLLDLFALSTETVALVIDPVPLPVRCERAVDLSAWPARSADTQVASLVRWLESGDRSSDFGRAAKRKLQRSQGGKSAAGGGQPAVDRTGLGALGVLLLVVALVVGVAMQDDGLESVAQPQPQPQPTAPRPDVATDGARLPAREAATTSSIAGGQTIAGPGIPQNTTGGADATLSVPGVEDPVVEDLVTESPVVEATLTETPPPPAQRARSSLAHLCRASSPAAALAWYGVLTRQQREVASRAICVRDLIQRPGYEALGELIAQS